MSRFRLFVTAAEFEDAQLLLGTQLSIADVADRAEMSPEEARRHADQMIRDGLAEAIPRRPGHIRLDHDALKFARRRIA